MERVVSLGDLPLSPSRDEVFAVVLSPHFIGIPVRVIEGIVVAAEAERTRIERIFGRYVPAQVAEQLLHAGQLAPQQREASIIFADIEGFTQLSQSMPPARVISLLDSFFSATTTIIDERGGVVVNHIGDAVIAAFNAPLPVEGHAARASFARVESRDLSEAGVI